LDKQDAICSYHKRREAGFEKGWSASCSQAMMSPNIN
jgi:hypothetical protein